MTKIIYGVIIVVVSNFLRAPRANEMPPVEKIKTRQGGVVAALTFHSITNGVGRPLNGWISDHIGRANMMGIAFGIEAVCERLPRPALRPSA